MIDVAYCPFCGRFHETESIVVGGMMKLLHFGGGCEG